MTHQWYWKSWGLSYNKVLSLNDPYPLYLKFLIVGPFQMKWYGE